MTELHRRKYQNRKSNWNTIAVLDLTLTYYIIYTAQFGIVIHWEEQLKLFFNEGPCNTSTQCY